MPGIAGSQPPPRSVNSLAGTRILGVMQPSDHSARGSRIVGPQLFAGLVAFGVIWGGAAALSWHTWFARSAWWAGERQIATRALRAADARLFLEDAIVVTVIAAALLVGLTLRFRRVGRSAFALLWGLVGLGAVLWTVSFLAAPRPDQIMIDGRCTYSDGPSESEGTQGIDIRGWSWTRFSLIIVRTGSRGTDEVTCR